jgi:hypothetical protein
VHALGAVLAVLSAATFALTNATGRRGVITGTPVQGMVISMPVGLLCFLAVAFLTGALESLIGSPCPRLRRSRSQACSISWWGGIATSELAKLQGRT